MTVVKLIKYKVPCNSRSIDPEATVLDFLNFMVREKTDAALVIGKIKDSTGKEIETLFGLVTDTDYRLKGEVLGRSAKSTTVKEIMTPVEQIVFVKTNTRFSRCLSLMQDNNFNHLVVRQIIEVEYEKGEDEIEVVQEEDLWVITYKEVAWTLLYDEELLRFEHFGMMEHQT